MKTFRLTYQVVTEESAQRGDFAHYGFVTRNGAVQTERNYFPAKPATFRLKDAVAILLDRESEGPVQADSCPVTLEFPPRWFNYGGRLDEYGQAVTIGLHIPDGVTPSSRMRIARALRCYGVKS